MKAPFFSIMIVLLLIVSAPPRAAAAWWGWGGDIDQRELDLEGYDTNTVITVRGRIAAIHSDDSKQVRVDVETGNRRVVVVLGPRDYWKAHGIKLTIGDRITVRGSKAQGKNGVVFLLAQKISEESRGQEVAIRSDTGRPAWSSESSRVGFGGGPGGQMHQNSPGRMGGGRMMGR
jgi:hypothetical protein